MDSPELTEKFIRLASMDNTAIVLYYRHVIVPILRRFIRPDDTLIDLGCAGGVLLTLLREKGFRNLFGMDIAPQLLANIPDRSIRTVCDNYLNVHEHFPAGFFSAAIVFNTLHHLDSREEYVTFFEHLSRVIQPGGLVLVKELRNGMFYRIYNSILWSPVINALFPSLFRDRNFVQTEERQMHSRFFGEFVPNLRRIVEAQGKFRIEKILTPLTFERLIVLRLVGCPLPREETSTSL